MYCIVYGHTIAIAIAQCHKNKNEPAAAATAAAEVEFRRAKQIDYRPYRETAYYRKPEIIDGHKTWTPQRSWETADSPAFCFESQKFCWLPTDFEISTEEGGNTTHARARALGYINNLHPIKQGSCYRVIEQLVARFIPMWERVLGETAAVYDLPARTGDWYERVQRSYYGGSKNWRMGGYREEVVGPSLLGPFYAHPKPPIVELNDCSLQIIVKMANIYMYLVRLSYTFPFFVSLGKTKGVIVFDSDSRKPQIRGRNMARRRNGE